MLAILNFLSGLATQLLKWNVFRSNILQRFEQKFKITSEKQFKGTNNWFEITNVQGTDENVRDSERSRYPVFEITSIDCKSKIPRVIKGELRLNFLYRLFSFILLSLMRGSQKYIFYRLVLLNC